MTKSHFPPFAAVLLLCSAALGETISITDFGGKHDGVTDDGPALRRAIEFAASHPGTTLRLDGTCLIKTAAAPRPPGRIHGWSALNGAAGEGITGLTIENGEIDLDGPFQALAFEKCKGVTLRNLVFDYVPPILSQGSVVATDVASRSMTVVSDPGYPKADEGFKAAENTWFTVHKPDGEPAYFFVGFVLRTGTDSAGRTVLSYGRPDLARAIEGQKNLRYVRVQRSFGNMLNFKFCDKVRIEGCSIYSTSAFAGLFSFCNDVTLTGNRICPRPGSGTIVSSCADGFHFIGARRGPLIENNFFDRMEDDNIVISLRGNRIKSSVGNKVQLMPSSVTWYEQGDTLEVVTLNDGKRRDYKIVSMPPQTSLWNPPAMILDRPLEGSIVPFDQGNDTNLPTLAFNKSWRLDGTVIRNNRFQNTRRYAVFMGAGGVRIEDNWMSGFTGAAILCSHYDMLKGKGPGYLYYPYYITDNLVVEHNTILRAFNYGEDGRKVTRDNMGAIDIYDTDRARDGIGNLRLASNIMIKDNTIGDSGYAGIHVANASDVTITGNTIVDPDQRAEANRYGIWVEASSKVAIGSNNVQGGSLDAPVRVDP